MSTRNLRGDDDLGAVGDGIRHSASDGPLIFIVERRVEQPVPGVDSGRDRSGAGITIQAIGAEADGWQYESVVRGAKFCVRHGVCSFEYSGQRTRHNGLMRCPCLSGDTFESCCAPILSGESAAPTAERLMRSRFTAFAMGDAAYLLKSWHPSTRPSELDLDPDVRWTRLDILETSSGGPFD